MTDINSEQHIKGKTSSWIARTIALLALISVVSVLAGCGDSKDESSGSTASTSGVTKNEAAAAKVPAAIRDAGKIIVAMDATYPPNEFLAEDGKTIEGTDADLAKAIGATLGLETELKNVTFDAIIPGLAAGKYDIALSSFTDTKEREETVDMVTYLTAGTKFMTTTSEPSEVDGLAGLCGLTVAVEKGTTQADAATEQSKKCEANGKDPVKVDVFPDQNGANLALTTGRAQIGMADSPVAIDIVDKSEGKLKATGTDFGTAPYGVAISKKSGLTEAIQLAVQSLIDSGEYMKILEKWNVEDGAIETSKINDGVE